MVLVEIESCSPGFSCFNLVSLNISMTPYASAAHGYGKELYYSHYHKV